MFNSLGLSPFLKENKQYFYLPYNAGDNHQELETVEIHTRFDL